MAIKLDQVSKLVRNVFNNNARIYQNNFSAVMMGNFAKDTPIKEGFAKGNWSAAEGDPVVRPTSNKDQSKTGRRAQRKAQEELNRGVSAVTDFFKANIGSYNNRKTYIKNGVDATVNRGSSFSTDDAEGDSIGIGGTGGYIVQLENGKSLQAPNGFFYLNLANAKRASRRALKL